MDRMAWVLGTTLALALMMVTRPLPAVGQPTDTPAASTATPSPTPTSTATPVMTPAGTCAGDCDGNQQVSVDEILTLVNIALGNALVSACPRGDANNDNTITVDEILMAVSNALNGCPLPPTFTVSGTITSAGGGVPLAGVTVELQGNKTIVVQTDASGHYSFENVPAGTWQLQASKSDDLGQAIDVSDAVLAFQIATGAAALTPERQLACDVNSDGAVTQDDGNLLGQYANGSITTFPAWTNCGSEWLFMPVPQAVAHQSVTQPSLAPQSCQPGVITLDPLDGDAPGQDFRALLIGDCNLNWPG